MRNLYTLIFAILCSYTGTLAQSDDSTKRFKLLPLPSVFHTPETSWGFGVTLLGFHTPKDTHTRESNAQVFLDATLRKQLSFQTDFNIFTSKNKYYIKGSHDLSKFPEFYFGIGNENGPNDNCLIDISYFDAKLALYRQTKKDIYIGPIFHHQNLQSINKEIHQEDFDITDMGYRSTGAGLGLLLDKRNNILSPSDGYYVETKLAKYFDGSNMTNGFVNHVLDLRYYKTFNKLIFNSSLYTVHNSGIVPFRMMPYLGGPRFMRGYYAGRFRDNNLGFLQAEFRRNVFWRIGVAAFGGIGQVYNNINQFNPNRMHYNYGAGLRFQLSKDSPANIRIDYGCTRDSNGFYVVFGECF